MKIWPKDRGGNKLDTVLKDVEVPILILDTVWLSHFKDTDNEKVRSSMAKVKDIMKENGRINEQRENLTIRKKQCLKKIMDLSVENDVKDAMELLKDEVHKINAGLKENKKKADSLPKKLDRANRELLLASVDIYYEKMRENQDRLAELTPQVEQAHERLKILMDEKLTCEENVEKTYYLLHSILGSNIIGKLDEAYDGDRK